MVCNSKKRARPSTHVKRVRTRKGKKTIVVNPDVRAKKTKRARHIPIRSGRIIPKREKGVVNVKGEEFDPLRVLENLKDSSDKKELTNNLKASQNDRGRKIRKQAVKNALDPLYGELPKGWENYASDLDRLDAQEKKAEKEAKKKEFLDRLQNSFDEGVFKERQGFNSFKIINSEEDLKGPKAFKWSSVMKSGFEPVNPKKNEAGSGKGYIDLDSDWEQYGGDASNLLRGGYGFRNLEEAKEFLDKKKAQKNKGASD